MASIIATKVPFIQTLVAVTIVALASHWYYNAYIAILVHDYYLEVYNYATFKGISRCKPDIGHAASRISELANKSCGVSNVVTLSKPTLSILCVLNINYVGFDKVTEARELVCNYITSRASVASSSIIHIS